MKLGMMLEVDETFTTIWLSRSSEVRVKVTLSPLLVLFLFYIQVTRKPKISDSAPGSCSWLSLSICICAASWWIT